MSSVRAFHRNRPIFSLASTPRMLHVGCTQRVRRYRFVAVFTGTGLVRWACWVRTRPLRCGRSATCNRPRGFTIADPSGLCAQSRGWRPPLTVLGLPLPRRRELLSLACAPRPLAVAEARGRGVDRASRPQGGGRGSNPVVRSEVGLVPLPRRGPGLTRRSGREARATDPQPRGPPVQIPSLHSSGRLAQLVARFPTVRKRSAVQVW